MREPFTVTLQIAADRWLSFRDPVLVLRADTADAVRRTLVDVEQLTRDRGFHAVGFLTYEAAAAFGLHVTADPGALPAAWFALYEPKTVTPVGAPVTDGAYALGALTPTVDRATFGRAFDRIKAHLAAGETYQVNYTFAMEATFEGDPFALFADLCAAQRGQYSAYIELGDHVICSGSPELFFELRGLDILARPMKGTARRGLTLEEDRAIGATLAESPKDRAENVMIVDMIRNDLGRVAETGTVDVSELFSVQRYPNVWQMTSLVKARSIAPLDEIFAAMHPCASVTGAPKVRTMELLSALERGPRGIYTGAIGHVPPDGLARFNVAIRTALIDRRAGRLSFGIGSGIVWDSDASAEYDECLLKGSVLGVKQPAFDLLETLRWSPDEGFYLLERHLNRLAESAEYFERPVLRAAVSAALADVVAGASSPMRVRLLVGADGRTRAEATPLVPLAEPVRLKMALAAVDRRNPFLYHKTTHRAVYEEARASVHDCDDVVLWNQAGEVTECTIANLAVDIGGELVTPPVGCGLLAGTYRAEMLVSGRLREQTVTVDELRRASRMWVINSVQGMRTARLVD